MLPRPITALGALSVVSFLFACQENTATDADAPPAAPTVIIGAVVSEEVRDSARFVGQVEALDQVSLLARSPGFIEKIAFEDGQSVETDQVLFEIERAPYEADVAAAWAELARTEADLDLAQLNLARDRQLLTRETIAQAQFDTTAAAEAQAQARVKAAQAALQRAEIDLGYTTITAPFDGRIGQKQFSVGEVVGPDSGPLATIVSLDPIRVRFSFSERDLVTAMQSIGAANLREALASDAAPTLTLILPNGTEYEHVGRITFLDNAIDPQTGTLRTLGTFENPEGLLFSGQFVTVVIEGAQAVSRLLVPQAAIQRDQRGDFVLVVGSDSLVEQRYIETGDVIDQRRIVLSGLQIGESVIVQGLQRVRPGVPVDAVSEEDAPPPETGDAPVSENGQGDEGDPPQ